ncbi:MAG: mannonate dehydratase [Saprospiraceae bacterium]|nr:mannonate dehydratase [Saprospiraceae bacterium]
MKYIEQTMRWYGPRDPVPLSYIRQAGATGIVSALHDIDTGEVWSVEDILSHKAIIEKAGMSWSVVESVNVHESIKIADNMRDHYIDQYRQTIHNLGGCGIKTICYNFMPATDWCRTDLSYRLADGSMALRFERLALLAFDLHILMRRGAENDYCEADLEVAERYFLGLNEAQRQLLQTNITLGLPGGSVGLTLDQVRERLETYQNVDSDQLRNNLKYFLQNIIDVAENQDIKMTIHPDDPPFSLFGLPRIVSTEADAQQVVDAVPSVANGLCLCTGSYGVRPDNDLPGMANRLAKHIHFIHLRNVKREANGNFYEDDHLAGATDMYGVMKAICAEQQKRNERIPMRPDHGHAMLDDLEKVTYPGYTAIGRLRGLAELRGLEHGILKAFHQV